MAWRVRSSCLPTMSVLGCSAATAFAATVTGYRRPDHPPDRRIGTDQKISTTRLNDPIGTGDSCPQQLWDRIDAQVLAKEYQALGAVKNGTAEPISS